MAGDTKLSGAINTLGGRDAISRDLNRLEKWARVNLIKFNMAKAKDLHMGWGNPQYRDRQGMNGLRAALWRTCRHCVVG